jgi:hypothetical protein
MRPLHSLYKRFGEHKAHWTREDHPNLLASLSCDFGDTSVSVGCGRDSGNVGYSFLAPAIAHGMLDST